MSARLSDVWLFLDVKLCKFNVLHNPSRFQHYDRPHYNSKCNIKSKTLYAKVGYSLTLFPLNTIIVVVVCNLFY